MSSPTLTQGYAAAWSVAFGGSVTVDVPAPGGGGHVALLVTVVVSYVGPDTTPVTATYGGVPMTLVRNVDRAWTFELLNLASVASDDLVLTKGLAYDLGIEAAWVMSGGAVVRIDHDDASGGNPGTVTTTLDPGSRDCVAYVAATADKSGGVPTSDIDSASGTGQTVLSEAAYPGSGRVMFTARKYDVAASQAFGVTVGGAVGHGIGVAAALYGSPVGLAAPEPPGAEAGIVDGFEVTQGPPVIIAFPIGGGEAGIPPGFRISAQGPAQVLLQVPGRDRPQMTEDGEAGQVLTYNASRKPSWEEPGGGSGTPATTVTDETTWGISPAVGTDTEYARQDHTHGTPEEPTGAAAGMWVPVMDGLGNVVTDSGTGAAIMALIT